MSPRDLAEVIRFVTPYTMLDEVRISALIRETERAIQSGVPGAMVECGVWRGGSMMAVARALLQMGVQDRDFYLFDTYAGMPAPEAVDVDLHGRSALDLTTGSYDPVGCTVGLLQVQKAMALTGYPPERMCYVAGKVEDTIPFQGLQQIALLHLDMDWYRPTRHALEQLFPLLSARGCLMIDDYGHWWGARKATDEYREAQHLATPLVAHGYTAVSMVKEPTL